MPSRSVAWLAVGVAAALSLASAPPAPPRPSPAQVAAWFADLDAAARWLSEGQVEPACETYARVRAELPARGGPTLLRARVLDGLGDCFRTRGAAAEAIEAYQQAVGLWDETLGPNQPRIAVTLHNLGVVLVAADRHDEARVVLDRALAIWSASPRTSAEAENTRRLLAQVRGRASRGAP